RISEDLSTHDMAVQASKIFSDNIVFYRAFSHSFPWILHHPTVVVVSQGELASDDKLSPELFLSLEDFWKNWNSEMKLVVLTDKPSLWEFVDGGVKPAHFLGQNRKFVLLSNFAPSNR